MAHREGKGQKRPRMIMEKGAGKVFWRPKGAVLVPDTPPSSEDASDSSSSESEPLIKGRACLRSFRSFVLESPEPKEDANATQPGKLCFVPDTPPSEHDDLTESDLESHSLKIVCESDEDNCSESQHDILPSQGARAMQRMNLWSSACSTGVQHSEFACKPTKHSVHRKKLNDDSNNPNKENEDSGVLFLPPSSPCMPSVKTLQKEESWENSQGCLFVPPANTSVDGLDLKSGGKSLRPTQKGVSFMLPNTTFDMGFRPSSQFKKSVFFSEDSEHTSESSTFAEEHTLQIIESLSKSAVMTPSITSKSSFTESSTRMSSMSKANHDAVNTPLRASVFKMLGTPMPVSTSGPLELRTATMGDDDCAIDMPERPFVGKLSLTNEVTSTNSLSGRSVGSHGGAGLLAKLASKVPEYVKEQWPTWEEDLLFVIKQPKNEVQNALENVRNEVSKPVSQQENPENAQSLVWFEKMLCSLLDDINKNESLKSKERCTSPALSKLTNDTSQCQYADAENPQSSGLCQEVEPKFLGVGLESDCEKTKSEADKALAAQSPPIEITNKMDVKLSPVSAAAPNLSFGASNEVAEVELSAKNEGMQLKQFALRKARQQPKGLGIWRKDRQTKKSYYISLAGRRLEGAEGFRQSVADKKTLAEKGYQPADRSQLTKKLPGLSTPDPKLLKGQSALCLTTYGVPEAVVESYSARGVKSMFQWQAECLQAENGAPLLGKNLVYSAPTSGGKTLVAEIAMLRSLTLHGGAALFVVPFIALAEEKTEYFQEVWAPLQLGVRAFHGEDGGATLTNDVSVAVCTIEKANSLVNRLLEEGRLGGLGIVVVDEAHMVGDGHRGYLLELMLGKLKAAVPNRLQIVALSATLPNLSDLSKWLDAVLYTTNFRPVTLKHFLCQHRVVYGRRDSGEGWQQQRTLTKFRHQNDPEGVAELCEEVLLRSHKSKQPGRKRLSVLVFCPSKNWTITCATHLAENLKSQLQVPPDITLARGEVLEKLRQTQVGLCPHLERSVPFGIAYHNAGLTLEERKIVENGFRSGALSVLVATSTLAAGVNLPAFRVIVRSPTIGKSIIDAASFHQMAGRAGRKGEDTMGEAFLILPSRHSMADCAHKLLDSPLPPLQSLLDDTHSDGLKRAMLEVVTCGLVKDLETAMKFFRCTLLSIQKEASLNIKDLCEESLAFLLRNRFIFPKDPGAPRQQQESSGESISEDLAQISSGMKKSPTSSQKLKKTLAAPGIHLQPSQLGKATFFSSLSPTEAISAVQVLNQAQAGLVLTCDLHIIYVLTPAFPNVEPDWHSYIQIYSSLSSSLKQVAAALGIQERFLMNAMTRPPPYGSRDPTVIPYRRFFVALVLHELVHEAPLSNVSSRVNIPRGTLQSLQRDTSTFCGQLLCFCRYLRWERLVTILEPFQDRLGFGVQPELVPLARLGEDVPPFRARALYEAGFKDTKDIASASPEALLEVLLDCSPFQKSRGKASNCAQGKQSNNKTDGKAEVNSLADGVNDPLQKELAISHHLSKRLAIRIIQKAKRIVRKEAENIMLSLPHRNAENISKR